MCFQAAHRTPVAFHLNVIPEQARSLSRLSCVCEFGDSPRPPDVYSGKRGGQNLRKKENGVRRSRDQKIKGIVVRVIERLYLGCLGGIGKEVKPKQG